MQVIDIIEFLGAYKDLGIAGVALIIMAVYGKWMAEKAFSQVKEANKQLSDANTRAEEAQKQFREFIQDEYKKNQQTMASMVSAFDTHVAKRDEALELLKDMIDERRRCIIFDRTSPEEFMKKQPEDFIKKQKKQINR